MIWVGKKFKEDGVISKPMIQTVNDMIERTSRVTGKSPEWVFDHGFAYTKPKTAIPMHVLLGAAGAGGAAAASAGGETKQQ